MTVKSYHAQGNHHLRNVVAVTGEAPVCAPSSQLCTDHGLVPKPQMPITGAGLAWGAVGASLLLFLGGAAVMITRRKREQMIEID